MVEQYLDKINKRKEDIARIAGENSSIEQQQIAELYIESENIRREAYEDIRALKEKIDILWIAVIGIVVYIILK